MSSEEKSKKYDRQIRLWGTDGQQRLEQINIAVLNGGPLGSEILKNLVLPGIGKFTVVDHRDVDFSDFGNNFFVDGGSTGGKRAQEVVKFVHELNGWVQEANAVVRDPVQVIDEDIQFFKGFNVVVATELPEVQALKLANACEEFGIPLFIVRINGFFGTIRLCSPEHCIIQTNPEFPQIDLRVHDAFPEFQEFVDSYDLGSLSSHDHSHVPYPVLLVKALDSWKSSHEGAAPSGRDQINEFKQQLKDMKITAFEDNFDEALNKAYLATNDYEIPEFVQEILDDDRAKNTLVDHDFWILANALYKFVEQNGTLPLLGSVPDLHSTTESFVQLQRIFNSKANQDVQVMTELVKNNLQELGLPEDRISDEDIKTFCKNAFNLRVIKYRTLQQELEEIHQENLGNTLLDFMTFTEGNGVWFLALRAAERFHAKHGRYPGENIDNYEDDMTEFKAIANTYFTEVNQTETVDEKFLQEIARYGNAQLHSVASYLGGVTAQEIIKVMTHKWIPMNNTHIYNALNSTSTTAEF